MCGESNRPSADAEPVSYAVTSRISTSSVSIAGIADADVVLSEASTGARTVCTCGSVESEVTWPAATCASGRRAVLSETIATAGAVSSARSADGVGAGMTNEGRGASRCRSGRGADVASDEAMVDGTDTVVGAPEADAGGLPVRRRSLSVESCMLSSGAGEAVVAGESPVVVATGAGVAGAEEIGVDGEGLSDSFNFGRASTKSTSLLPENAE